MGVRQVPVPSVSRNPGKTLAEYLFFPREKTKSIFSQRWNGSRRRRAHRLLQKGRVGTLRVRKKKGVQGNIKKRRARFTKK